MTTETQRRIAQAIVETQAQIERELRYMPQYRNEAFIARMRDHLAKLQSMVAPKVTFADFVASRCYVDNLQAATGAADCGDGPGFLYLGSFWIEIVGFGRHGMLCQTVAGNADRLATRDQCEHWLWHNFAETEANR